MISGVSMVLDRCSENIEIFVSDLGGIARIQRQADRIGTLGMSIVVW